MPQVTRSKSSDKPGADKDIDDNLSLYNEVSYRPSRIESSFTSVIVTCLSSFNNDCKYFDQPARFKTIHVFT